RAFRLQTSTSTASATLTYPVILGSTPQSVCWSHDENTIVFENPLKQLFFYSLSHQQATEATLSAPLNVYTGAYCDSAHNMLYFTVQNNVYKKGFRETSSQKLPVSAAIFVHNPLFSTTTPDTILVSTGSALMQVNLL